MSHDWIVPEWRAPAKVRALITTRAGGVSEGLFASMNLGLTSGDRKVSDNRAILRTFLPSDPVWLQQSHGNCVVLANGTAQTLQADASYTCDPGIVCAILTADCLPVLLCDDDGTTVAAAHAGWRGLAAGVLDRTVRALSARPASLMAYFGPAIGPQAFEVGDEVRSAFIYRRPESQAAFKPRNRKWLADIFMLARFQLLDAGVTRIFGGDLCTFSNGGRFFSHRRDGLTGRMASLIWLTPEAKATRP